MFMYQNKSQHCVEHLIIITMKIETMKSHLSSSVDLDVDCKDVDLVEDSMNEITVIVAYNIKLDPSP